MIVPLAPQTTFEDSMVALQPDLLAEALKLTGSRDRAEDLVQDAICKALGAKSRPEILRAWLISIMRNLHVDQWRRDHPTGHPTVAFEDVADEAAEDEMGNLLRWHGPSGQR